MEGLENDIMDDLRINVLKLNKTNDKNYFRDYYRNLPDEKKQTISEKKKLYYQLNKERIKQKTSERYNKKKHEKLINKQ